LSLYQSSPLLFSLSPSLKYVFLSVLFQLLCPSPLIYVSVSYKEGRVRVWEERGWDPSSIIVFVYDKGDSVPTYYILPVSIGMKRLPEFSVILRAPMILTDPGTDVI